MQHMDMTGFEWAMIYTVMGAALLALAYAGMLARQILAYDKGTEAMQQVWKDIKSGANAYLQTQLKTVALMIAITTAAMFFSVWIVRPTPEAFELFGDNARMIIATGRALAFLMGSTFSAIVG